MAISSHESAHDFIDNLDTITNWLPLTLEDEQATLEVLDPRPVAGHPAHAMAAVAPLGENPNNSSSSCSSVLIPR